MLLEQKPTDIFDGSTAIIADSGDCKDCTIENVKIEKVQTQENPNINGIAEMAALGLHVWRNEIDEMHRRVGEIRDSSESIDGVWARVNNGQARYGNQDVKNNYTSVQVGYDRQVSPGVWVGGALSYTDGDNDFRYGDGETDLYAFSLYNSWLFDNGIYLDLVSKIGRMKNSFDIQYDAVDSSGDYHTNAVSLSAELGWRYYATESLFVEPQAEMWYGHVFDADYRTSTGIDVDNKSVDSLVGRLGLKLGFDFPDELGSFFVKASVLHDWEGDADFTFRKGDIERSLTESLGGTWYEYGLGAKERRQNLQQAADNAGVGQAFALANQATELVGNGIGLYGMANIPSAARNAYNVYNIYKGTRNLENQLQRGNNFEDIYMGRIDRNKLNEINNIRQELGEPTIPSEKVVIPKDRVEHIYNRRIAEYGYSPKDAARTISDALFNKESKVYPSRYSTLQKMESPSANRVVVGKIRNGNDIFVKTGYRK